MLQTGRGVTTPQNQGSPANEGPANTVISAMKAEFVIVEYFNTEGRRQQDVLLKAGNEFYTPPNSVVWAASLRSVRPWLSAGVKQKLPIDGSAAVGDAVDVIPGV